MVEAKVLDGLIMLLIPRNAPIISHLLFVDFFIFLEVSLQLAWLINNILQEFDTSWGGLKQLLWKMLFLSLPATIRRDIAVLFGYYINVLPFLYLGLPLISSKLSYSMSILSIRKMRYKI